MTENLSSTLAAIVVGTIVSATHERDAWDRSWLTLRYGDGRTVILGPTDGAPNGTHFGFSQERWHD